MNAWAAIAIAQAVLVAVEIWRLSRTDGRRAWPPGIALFAISALALVVMVNGAGPWRAIAVFGSIVLASDALLLGGQLAIALCTRAEAPR